MKRFVKLLSLLAVGVFLFVIFAGFGSFLSFFGIGHEGEKPKSEAILVVDLRGVILDGRKILQELRSYAGEPQIKGVLVRIDSPGGVVGPSQEIFADLDRIRKVLKKPVVASCGGVCASGAYYAALGADQIFVNPGTLVGSIGVIMEFANLEGLYSWAKVRRYSMTTGKFKDTGADYRDMRPEEREYIQSTLLEVLDQFKTAVQVSRQISPAQAAAVADGRIFTGLKAIELKLADATGSYSEALRQLGKLSGLGEDPEVFRPPRPRSFMDFIQGGGEDEVESVALGKVSVADFAREVFLPQILGRPLYLMPSARWW